MRNWLASIIILAVHAPAQAPQFTVGGSNPDFLDLPAAVATVPQGSILRVRNGTFTGFRTSKPLSIHLEFQSTNLAVQAPAGASYVIEVTNLPMGTMFEFDAGGNQIGTGSLGGIRIANCLGRVYLERVTVFGQAAALDLQNVASVVIQQANCIGLPGLSATDAVVAGTNVNCGPPATSTAPTAGLEAIRSLLDLAHGSWRGQDNPGARLIDCHSRFAGDGTTEFRVLSSGAPQPTAALETIGGSLTANTADFVFLPGGGAAPVLTVGTSVVGREVPAVVAAGAAAGSTASATLFHNGGGPGLLLLGSGMAPSALGSMTQVWLDLGQPIVLLAAGMVTSAGLGRQVVVPATAAVRGAVFFVQGAVLDSVGLVASVPGVWALR